MLDFILPTQVVLDEPGLRKGKTFSLKKVEVKKEEKIPLISTSSDLDETLLSSLG